MRKCTKKNALRGDLDARTYDDENLTIPLSSMRTFKI